MSQPASILIADDDELIRQSTADLLRLSGHRCDLAAYADEAIAMLEAAPYDLLISDVIMPGNRRLRLVHEAYRIAPEMPAVLVSSSVIHDSLVATMPPTVRACLSKPVPYRELRDQIEAALAETEEASV